MASKTLIRSQKKHEVKLSKDGHLAQSSKAQGEPVPLPVPESIRKGGAKRTSTASTPRSASLTGTGTRTAAARGKASLVSDKAPSQAKKPSKAPRPQRERTEKAAPSPRLPAFVPADGLWEADSTVMQRLQALNQRNAQLSEQLQRIQNHPVPKGREP